MDTSVWLLLLAIAAVIGCAIGYVIGVIDTNDERKRK
jgi:hypothetical protein